MEQVAVYCKGCKVCTVTGVAKAPIADVRELTKRLDILRTDGGLLNTETPRLDVIKLIHQGTVSPQDVLACAPPLLYAFIENEMKCHKQEDNDTQERVSTPPTTNNRSLLPVTPPATTNTTTRDHANNQNTHASPPPISVPVTSE